MKKSALLFLGILTFTQFSIAATGETPAAKATEVTQTETIVNGTVIDAQSNEALSGVLIQFENTNAYSDLSGNFQVKDLKPGIYSVKAKYISYQDAVFQKVEVKAGKDNKLEIKLLAGE
jgi:hypothetical protein